MKTKLVNLEKYTIIAPKEDTQYILKLSPDQSGVKDLVINLGVSDVVVEVLGLFNLKRGQNLRISTVANHLVPRTECRTIMRMVMGDNSASEYEGKIIIERMADQTASSLDINTLVIGGNTNCKVKPILEIKNNNVKASHGSATGRVDEGKLYYLQSRGMSQIEAENLVLEGFFDEWLKKMEDNNVRRLVESNLYA